MNDQRSQQELAELLNLTTPATSVRSETRTTEPSALELINGSQQPEDSQSEEFETITESSRGYKRFLFVSIVTGLIVSGGVGFFLTMMNIQGSSQPVAVKPIEAETDPNEIKVSLRDRQDELYRAKIALGEQKQDIARIDELKAQKIALAEPKKPEPEPAPQPKPVPQPVVRPPQPTPPPVTYRPKPAPIQRRTSPKPVVRTEPKPQYDSMADWQALATFGSYGANQNGEIESTPKRRATNVVNITPSMQTIAPTKLSPYLMASRAREYSKLSPIATAGYSSEAEAITAQTEFISALESIDSKNSTVTQKKPTAKAALNQTVKAKLLNPVQWVANSREAEEKYPVFINLEEDLLDARGKVLIPEDSQLVYIVERVTPNGIIRGTINSAIIDGQEVSFPNNAIAIRNKKGGLLMAKYKDIKNGGSNRDVIRFASGALGGLSEVIAQPKSTSSSSTSFGTSISTDYGDRDYLGTAVSKGAADALEGRASEMDRLYERIPAVGMWEIKEGKKISLIVTRSFSLE